MCDDRFGCQLRTNYFGFRIGANGSIEGGMGDYSGVPLYEEFGFIGGIAGGFDVALSLRRPQSESPQDGSFEGFGVNLGYSGEWSTRGTYRHIPYFSLELWTHDACLTPYLGLGYTLEQTPNGDRHGGRLFVGTLWRPFTSPMQGHRVNPYIGAHIYLGANGGDGQGGVDLGLNLTVGVDFFPLFQLP